MDARSPYFYCILRAWQAHERELLSFLRSRTGNKETSEDLLQEVFLKSVRHGSQFCQLDNARAWLFQVARTTLIDHGRLAKATQELPDDLAVNLAEERDAVDALDVCLARNLFFLNADDRKIIEYCDLQGVTVRVFSEQEKITLPAAKSRLLRARQRLREALIQNCQIKFDEQGHVCCHTPTESF